MNNRDWAIRKAAIEEVHSMVVSATAGIVPKYGLLFAALKERIADSNKNLASLVLSLLGEIATFTGPALAENTRAIKTILPAIIASLSDKRVVGSGIACLDEWVAQIGLRPVLEYLPMPLTENAAARKELLLWLEKHQESQSVVSQLPANVDLKPLIKPLLYCLEVCTPPVDTACIVQPVY
jgi:hypothetical protein